MTSEEAKRIGEELLAQTIVDGEESDEDQYQEFLCKAIKALEKQDRYNTLLKAAYDLLHKQKESPFVLDLLSETVVYDDCECDGHCLMDDIKDVIETEGNE